jgi:hypothetical protein
MNYLCVHGHFYQPPRENPSLEYVELQDSAYPYHDWNERITAECYAPNAAARLMDGQNRIVRIANNYEWISFNFGPTLLSWMQEKSPKTYQSILEADRASMANFGGHGSAVAQAYNHMIMPLANTRDKQTQVAWGRKDFEHRFGRLPEGMWLPETAVDIETLEQLAAAGIRFTILAPRQARRVRKLGGRSWKDVSGDRIDPTRAYLVKLPSKRSISVFFYDGPISRAVAFEGLLNNGETFANRLLSGFSGARDWPQLMHIATDGESYGHHHRFGEMALAYALNYIRENQLAQITNYAQYLELNPPAHQVEIFENSSWSCVHGVERWRSNCGCNSGGHPGWNQEWRAPLRAALDWLREAIAPRYEGKAAELLKDPWAARNAYIEAILDRSAENVERFLAAHAVRELDAAGKVTVLKLLEMQRHAMLMYTSCGWFFDEISGLESTQVLHYAGRAIQLAHDLFPGEPVEAEFISRLAVAKSNLPEHRDAALIYEKCVKPAIVDLPSMAAHYAISSIFESYGEHTQIYNYDVDREDYSRLESGRQRLALGRARFTSRTTRESATLSFGVVHFGDHNVNGGVRPFSGDQQYADTVNTLSEVFLRGDTPEVLRLLDTGFGHNIYSLKSLFADQQRKIINLILDSTLKEVGAALGRIYDERVPLMHFLADLRVAQPPQFQTLAQLAINSQLRQALSTEPLDMERLRNLLREAHTMQVALDNPTLEFLLRRRAEQMAERFTSNPADLPSLESLEQVVGLARAMPFEVNLWQVENLCAQKLNGNYREIRQRAEQGDENARNWMNHWSTLAEQLRLRVE